MLILTSSTCQPCKTLKQAFKDKPEVIFMDIESPEGSVIASERGIRRVPTLLKDGKEVFGVVEILRAVNN